MAFRKRILRQTDVQTDERTTSMRKAAARYRQQYNCLMNDEPIQQNAMQQQQQQLSICV